jgi:hypothetical protein
MVRTVVSDSDDDTEEPQKRGVYGIVLCVVRKETQNDDD